jgi:hypothetical protein
MKYLIVIAVTAVLHLVLAASNLWTDVIPTLRYRHDADYRKRMISEATRGIPKSSVRFTPLYEGDSGMPELVDHSRELRSAADAIIRERQAHDFPRALAIAVVSGLIGVGFLAKWKLSRWVGMLAGMFLIVAAVWWTVNALRAGNVPALNWFPPLGAGLVLGVLNLGGSLGPNARRWFGSA